VQDPDVRARFGIDHYYEIDLLIPLGDRTLKFGKDAQDKAAVYENEFPATLVVRQLPPGLSVGENTHQLIRADGVFFKIWTYKSEFAARHKQRQPAPLFVATQPEAVVVETPTNWVVSTLVFAAFFLAVTVVGIISWWQRTSDRKPARGQAGGGAELPPPDFRQMT
jgi:hypothetical protein